MRDFQRFARQMLRHPAEVMALAPSSAALAQAMTAGIGPWTGPVVELGPGTGRFTRLLLARGVRADELVLFEINPVFARDLRDRFPGVRIEERPAQDIATLGLTGVGAVVSGLPLLSMRSNDRRAILGGAFDAMRPDGVFSQFTYGPQPPVEPSIAVALEIVGQRGPYVFGNLPPARVYRYVRSDMAKGSGF
ncbi:MAG: class I SAM-dependent methyltransferase [Paracoccaceae bacterium]